MVNKYNLGTAFDIIDNMLGQLDKAGMKGNAVGKQLIADFEKVQRQFSEIEKAAVNAAKSFAEDKMKPVSDWLNKNIKNTNLYNAVLQKLSDVSNMTLEDIANNLKDMSDSIDLSGAVSHSKDFVDSLYTMEKESRGNKKSVTALYKSVNSLSKALSSNKSEGKKFVAVLGNISKVSKNSKTVIENINTETLKNAAASLLNIGKSLGMDSLPTDENLNLVFNNVEQIKTSLISLADNMDISAVSGKESFSTLMKAAKKFTKTLYSAKADTRGFLITLGGVSKLAKSSKDAFENINVDALKGAAVSLRDIRASLGIDSLPTDESLNAVFGEVEKLKSSFVSLAENVDITAAGGRKSFDILFRSAKKFSKTINSGKTGTKQFLHVLGGVSKLANSSKTAFENINVDALKGAAVSLRDIGTSLGMDALPDDDNINAVFNEVEKLKSSFISLADNVGISAAGGKQSFSILFRSVKSFSKTLNSSKTGTKQFLHVLDGVSKLSKSSKLALESINVDALKGAAVSLRDIGASLGIDSLPDDENLTAIFDKAANVKTGLISITENIDAMAGSSRESFNTIFKSLRAFSRTVNSSKAGADKLAGALGDVTKISGAAKSALENFDVGTLKNITDSVHSIAINLGIDFLPTAENLNPVFETISGVKEKLISATDIISKGAAGAQNAVKGFQLAKAFIDGDKSKARKIFKKGSTGDKIRTVLFSVRDKVETGKNIVGPVLQQGAAFVALKAQLIGAKAATIAFSIAQKASAAATAIMNGVMTVANALFVASPIGWIVLAIGALIVAIVLCVKYWDKITAALTAAWEWIKKTAGIIRDGLCSAFSSLAGFVNENQEKILAFIAIFYGPFAFVISIVKELKDNWGAIVETFQSDGIIAGIQKLGGVLLSGLLAPIQGLLELLAKIPGIGDKFAPAIDKIKELRGELKGIEAETPAAVYGVDSGSLAHYTSPVAPMTTAEQYMYSQTTNREQIEIGLRADPGTSARIINPPRTPNIQLIPSGAN